VMASWTPVGPHFVAAPSRIIASPALNCPPLCCSDAQRGSPPAVPDLLRLSYVAGIGKLIGRSPFVVGGAVNTPQLAEAQHDDGVHLTAPCTLVAIDRNEWSRCVGTSGRDHRKRAAT
jgi:hypothetical protein